MDFLPGALSSSALPGFTYNEHEVLMLNVLVVELGTPSLRQMGTWGMQTLLFSFTYFYLLPLSRGQ